jgi:hypothetical protein
MNGNDNFFRGRVFERDCETDPLVSDRGNFFRQLPSLQTEGIFSRQTK